MEESSLAGWIHRILSPHVDALVVCDPKHNALISKGNKNDVSDAVDLCRLYRLGEYVEVYHGDDDHRNDFKIVVKEYMDIGNDCTRLKSKITAKHRQAGIVDVQGTKIFNKLHHEHYLKLSQQRCEDSSFNGSTTVWTVRKPNERRFSRRSSS